MNRDSQASPDEASVCSEGLVGTKPPAFRGVERILMGVCALFAGVVAACTFHAGVKTGDNVPLVPGSSAEVSGSIGDGVLKLRPTPSVPEGVCVKVTWLDGSGKPIGTNNVTVGGDPVPIPTGSEGADFSTCDEEQQDLKVKRLDRLSLVTRPLQPFSFQEMPVNWSDGHGRWAEFKVIARSRSDAAAIANDFRDGMFLEPMPEGVKPGPIVDLEVLSDGRVRVTAMVQSAPTSLDLRWNGSALFTLNDAQVTSANGWYAVSCIVPAEMVETPSLFSSATNVVYVLVGQTDRGPWSFETEVEIDL